MKMKYTIQIYVPMMSIWKTIAKLDFIPDEYLLDKIANDASENMMIGYDEIRVKEGRTIIIKM